MISLTDKDGNSYGDSSIVVIGANGKVKPVSTGGGSPTGPAGGDLSGTYPNPSVVWNNGIPTYNSLYFPIPTGTTVQYIRGDGSLATFPAIPAQYNPTAGTGISITGAYPNQTITNTLTLTTTGTSGAATLVGSTLNIPQYSGGGGLSIIKLTSQTLLASSWTLSGGFYIYTFSNVNITTNTRVDFTPDNSAYSEVTTCGMLPEVDVSSGSCTFYSLFPPQSNILGEITIFPTI
jgi:hypothetical protein